MLLHLGDNVLLRAGTPVCCQERTDNGNGGRYHKRNKRKKYDSPLYKRIETFYMLCSCLFARTWRAGATFSSSSAGFSGLSLWLIR